LGDLKVNSARLVDVMLEMEDRFGIQVSDDEVDGLRTVGDAVRLVRAKTAGQA
jgi:acyl carrier protein